MYLLVAKQLVIMLIIAAAGFAVSKAFKFQNQEQKFVSKILLYFVNPALIISRFSALTFKMNLLCNFGIMIVISIAAHVTLTAAALLFARSKTLEGKELDGIDRLGIVFTNCGFIGIPLIEGAFGNLPGDGGKNAIFYLLGYIVVFNVYLWTVGIKMLGGKMNFVKIITNPNVISVIIGIGLFCAPFDLPEIISKPINYIGEMTVGISMLLLGMLFANFGNSNSKQEEKDPQNSVVSKKSYLPRVIKVSLIRCIIAPFICFFVILLFSKIFQNVEDIRLMCYVVLISVLCPIGMSVSGFAVIFNKDESYSGMTVLATSACCIVTIPLAIAFAEMIF